MQTFIMMQWLIAQTPEAQNSTKQDNTPEREPCENLASCWKCEYLSARLHILTLLIHFIHSARANAYQCMNAGPLNHLILHILFIQYLFIRRRRTVEMLLNRHFPIYNLSHRYPRLSNIAGLFNVLSIRLTLLDICTLFLRGLHRHFITRLGII